MGRDSPTIVCNPSMMNFINHIIDSTNNSNEFDNFELQSETFSATLPYKINLQLYKESTPDRHIEYEAELFPAMRFNYWDPTLVNVFHTGKVIIMGRRARAELPGIIAYLNSIFNESSPFTFK